MLSKVTKQCTKCKLKLSLTAFSKSENGRSNQCKLCRPYDQPIKIYRSIKLRNKKKRYGRICSPREFSDWLQSIPKMCYYCGRSTKEWREFRDKVASYTGKSKTIRKIKNMFDMNAFKCNRLTIDRRNSSKGYTIDNLSLCCLYCNMIKKHLLSDTEMKLVARKIRKRLEWTLTFDEDPS